ncbi:MAG TPA: SDR family oxidoreductase [Dongiaceae bacterium]|nr:SDR family oxidoreductase [Dongiaceae bacterium]
MNVVGKTVLITGSTDGVGRLVALRLAEAGARVLLHGRSQEKGERVQGELRAATGSDRLEYYRADFSALDEVRRLAAAVTAQHERIDLLINNAGIGFGPRDGQHRELSADGYELRFAVNYLAGFLLTHRLLPAIRRSAPARIVNVSSLGQQPIDFADVMLAKAYDGVRAYRQSKLAQIMFTIDLAAELAGAGVAVHALHPATYMNTNMVVESGIKPTSTVEQGADAILHVATADLGGETGLFFDGKRPVHANAQAYDPAARRRLRDLSLQLTGLAGG